MTDCIAHVNSLWGLVFAEEFARLGLRHVVIAPGSRSTPLVVALASHPLLTAHVVSDERSAAFLALALGRATRVPACFVTTSGSAMGHAYPAVLEAEADGVPLLCLSADRPPELRATGANQTLDQVHLFGGHVRAFFDLPCPDPQVPIANLRATLDAAVQQARSGPVHLNAMFREPLGPVPATLPPEFDRPGPQTRWFAPRTLPNPESLQALADMVKGARHGLLVVGALRDQHEQAAVRTLAARLGWPVFADVTSGLRGGPCVVPLFDQLLLAPGLRAAEAPDAVIQVGGAVTSKRLLQWLGEARPEWAVVRPDSQRRDPVHGVTLRVLADVAELAGLDVDGQPPLTRLARLQDASQQVDSLVEAFLARQAGNCEMATARTLARDLPAGHVLATGNSMPIRDLDMYAPQSLETRLVFSQRGASGIDGALATATGLALGCRAPVTMLLGDQTFLHDVGSLQLLAASKAPVTLVLADNRGGGIFQFLPVAGQTPVFERCFTAPHEANIANICAAFGVDCVAVDGDLGKALRDAWQDGRPRVLHVRTDGKANEVQHRDLQGQIRAHLARAWPE